MTGALLRLPHRLADAGALDWSNATELLSSAASTVAIGRGPTLSIAREAALKLKEVCNLHAEAFSGAEFLHGPVALVTPRYPAMMFLPNDEATAGMRGLAAELEQKGVALLVTGSSSSRPGLTSLPALPADQPEADAICIIQSFYVMAVALAARLGIDVDQPRHLRKVTRTT
jgi:glucosamine--fructose-6-phosphate aminotransferase (isomerizing)